jgi:hypothetical protein
MRFPSPTDPQPNRSAVLLGYLDYFRSVVLDKLDGLSETDLRSSRLPSGWTPLELLKHLTYVERRWLVWGFLGQEMPDPWGDSRNGRWEIGAGETFASLTEQLRQQAAVTRSIGTGHDLSEVGQPGERWDGAPPASLERILLHLVQEYARHAGHLDIVRELIDRRVGE